MIYKRAFGKKGLVAALVYEQDLKKPDVMTRFEAACIQCGITQDYAIDVFKTSHDPEHSDEAIDEMINHASDILMEGYRAVITVGDYAYRTMALAMDRHSEYIMHIGLDTESLEKNDTFRMSRIDPIFEKNISGDNRMYVIDKMTPDQVAHQKAERRKRAQHQKQQLGLGCMGVVGPDGRPTVIRVPSAEATDENGNSEEEIFEA